MSGWSERTARKTAVHLAVRPADLRDPEPAAPPRRPWGAGEELLHAVETHARPAHECRSELRLDRATAVEVSPRRRHVALCVEDARPPERLRLRGRSVRRGRGAAAGNRAAASSRRPGGCARLRCLQDDDPDDRGGSHDGGRGDHRSDARSRAHPQPSLARWLIAIFRIAMPSYRNFSTAGEG